MSSAYTIHGSEDGVIAVASSPESAVRIAAAYLGQNGDPVYVEGDSPEIVTDLAVAIRRLRRRDTHYLALTNCPNDVVAWSGANARAEIEQFETNYYPGLTVS